MPTWDNHLNTKQFFSKCLNKWIYQIPREKYLGKFTYQSYKSSVPVVFWKKAVRQNITKFRGEQLCRSLFFEKVAGSGIGVSEDFKRFFKTAFFATYLKGYFWKYLNTSATCVGYAVLPMCSGCQVFRNNQFLWIIHLVYTQNSS